MHIVLVLDQFDDGNNGTTVTARRYAQELRKLGHTVTILAGGEDAENKVGAPLHKIPIFEKLIESQGMKFAKPSDKSYYKAFKNADIVHFYMGFRFCRRGEEMARQLQLPTIAAFHTQPENITSSIGMGQSKAANRFLYWWFYHVFYNRFHIIHCPSDFIANELAGHHYDADLRVISNGVDDVFVPHPEIKRTRKPDETFNILMIGRLSGEKRQDLIIEAAKRSKYSGRIRLYFAGQGPKEHEYTRLSKGLSNLPVFGFYSSEELVRLINSCDLYVHASDAEIEGISCMEALACGLVPVISDSPLSATKQFALEDRSLFKAGDAGALAERIDYWIEHPDERLAMEEAYAKSGDKMRVSSCVRQAEQMYTDAIKEFHRKGYKNPGEIPIRRLTHPNAEKVNAQFAKSSSIRSGVNFWVRSIIGILLSFIDIVFLGLSVKGRKNLRAVESGAVTVCNHVHPMDCTAIKVATFPRSIWYTSLRRNLEIPFTGWLVKACGGLPLPEQPMKIARFQKELCKGINRGELIHFYPEGMLVKYSENLRPFHEGAFLTAVKADCPVLPMKITFREPHGIRSIWRHKPFMTLEFKPPLYPKSTLKERAASKDLMERTIRVMNEEEGADYKPAFRPEAAEVPVTMF